MLDTNRSLSICQGGNFYLALTIINNTMLIQIAVLAWLFLGEQITPGEIGGLLLVMIGTLIVQIARPTL
jgi:drug/metabolite transporter (DMT)-like permease